jgi:hypothetical protein
MAICDVSEFSREERRWLVASIADFWPYSDLIRLEFRRKFRKKMDDQVLRAFRCAYKTRIRATIKRRNTGAENSFDSLQVRLKLCLAVFEDACEVRRRGYEVNEDGVRKPKRCSNEPLKLASLRLANQMIIDAERLQIDRNKIPATANITGGSLDNWGEAHDDEIDDGVNFDVTPISSASPTPQEVKAL